MWHIKSVVPYGTAFFMWKGDKMSINVAREKILTYTAVGEETMSGLDDLLSVILGPYAKQEVVHELSNKKIKDLSEMTLEEMKQIGLTKNQALTLYSSMLMIKRYIVEEREKGHIISSPEDAANYVMNDMRNLNQEHLVAFFLNTKNEIIYRNTIFMGSLNASIVHPREIFREAIKRSSASVIVCHNHPSGSPRPSQEDIHVTRRLVESGKIVGIELLDHLVIGDRKFVSLKEKGYI